MINFTIVEVIVNKMICLNSHFLKQYVTQKKLKSIKIFVQIITLVPSGTI